MIPGIQSDHSGEWHWEKFADFSRLKALVGEPTPHMQLIQWLCRDQTEQERLWRAGCYAVGYSVLTAEAIWREWPWARYSAEPETFLPWLRTNWPGIHTRRPRRMVRTPEKFARCLDSYANWTQVMLPGLRGHSLHPEDPVLEYNTWWDSVNNIAFFGRYISIRVLELYRRWGLMNAHLYDIRAIGAHSPIRCLCLMRPADAPRLLTGEHKFADQVATDVHTELRQLPGLEALSPFAYAAILCEYRSCYEDRGDYPGHQTDEELEYTHTRYGDFWRNLGLPTQFFEARAACTPERARGELRGWPGNRKIAASTLRVLGENWSDLRWEYGDLEAGKGLVRWEGAQV